MPRTEIHIARKGCAQHMINHGCDLLITGFGPYPRVRVNPTDLVARRVGASPRFRRLGWRVVTHVFETSYAAVTKDLPKILAEHRPAARLHLGLAPRARFIRVETTGRGNPSRLAADHRGRTAFGAMLDLKKTPQKLVTSAPAAAILSTILSAGLPAKCSNQAGRYLCDTLYHLSLMHRDATNRPPQALFIHLPLPTPPTRRRRKTAKRFPIAAIVSVLIEAAIRLRLAARRNEAGAIGLA